MSRTSGFGTCDRFVAVIAAIAFAWGLGCSEGKKESSKKDTGKGQSPGTAGEGGKSSAGLVGKPAKTLNTDYSKYLLTDNGNKESSRFTLGGVRAPPFGFGGTYRGFRFGVNVTPELVVAVEVGKGWGPAGVSVNVITFSLKEGSFAFVPDPPEMSLELGHYRAVKWSPKDGLGQEFGKKFPTMKGRLVFDFKVGVPNSPGVSPLGTGALTYEKGLFTFTPSSLTMGAGKNTIGTPPSVPGAKPESLSDRLLFSLTGRRAEDIPAPAPHVLRFFNKWLPDKGYAWVDGSLGFHDSPLPVKWCPGQASSFPAHLHAAKEEGLWEPDSGYQWTGGSREPRPTVLIAAILVRWAPGTPSTEHPNVVAAEKEGQWLPAAGYTWVNSEPNDYRVKLVVR